jgi:hypothetical protein
MRRLLIGIVLVMLMVGVNKKIVYADPILPLPKVPITGDQDGSETPLVLNAPGFDLLKNVQTFQVPRGAGTVNFTFDFVFFESAYHNELGFFPVDNIAGQINGLNPGDSGD